MDEPTMTVKTMARTSVVMAARCEYEMELYSSGASSLRAVALRRQQHGRREWRRWTHAGLSCGHGAREGGGGWRPACRTPRLASPEGSRSPMAGLAALLNGERAPLASPDRRLDGMCART